MTLIADSGATKTDWIIISPKERSVLKGLNTSGINPFHQTAEDIKDIIYNELIQNIACYDFKEFDEIFFYGAGCLPESSPIVSNILENIFCNAKVEIYSDLMGAARALCKNSPGIACILGTGSNSCEYDGKDIIGNVSPLGYILGDEGSGAYIGKRFIGDCLKGLLPSYLKEGLLEEYNMTTRDILNRVYGKPQANRFLASTTHYIYKYRNDAHIKVFLKDCFGEFFRRNLSTYSKVLPVSFTGSIAWFFQNEIKETAIELGYKIGIFIKNPINGLAEFHCKQY